MKAFARSEDAWAVVLANCLEQEAGVTAGFCSRLRAPCLRVLMRVSSVCQNARLALGHVRRLRLESAAECHVRALRLLPCVVFVDVVCFQRPVGLEEVAADEAMARRLPYALSALPRLEAIDTDFEGCEDCTHQVTRTFKRCLLSIGDARLSGLLPALQFVDHGYLDCKPIDVNANEESAPPTPCLCAELLRGVPPHNLLAYTEYHGLCAGAAAKARALLERRHEGVTLDSPVCCADGRLRSEDWAVLSWLSPDTNKWKEVNLFSSSTALPTYFDSCFACSVNDGGYDAAIAVLVDSGGRPGPALRAAAQSGLLQGFVAQGRSRADVNARAEQVVAWVLGPDGVPPPFLEEESDEEDEEQEL